jgi:two-component system, NtrC family, response regulator HupR/HoxA
LSALPSVLVIDDEARSVEALERIIEDDFDVKKATSIEEAEAILADEAIQVVLCGQPMPACPASSFSKPCASAGMTISGYTGAEDVIQGVNEAGIYQYVAAGQPGAHAEKRGAPVQAR